MQIYKTTGSGFPVVLLHGFCENNKVWDKLTPMLPANYRYILPDLPGFGMAGDIASDSISGYANYIAEIIEKENIPEFILIGHSMGGYVSLEFAKHFPRKLKGMGLFHSHAFADSEEQKQARYKSIGFINKNGAEVYYKAFIKNLFAGTTPGHVIAEEEITLDGQSAAGLTDALKAMAERTDTTEVLKKMQVPVLFIFGKHDSRMPLQILLRQSGMAPVSQICILEHSGHMGMLEESSVSSLEIRHFLSFCLR